MVMKDIVKKYALTVLISMGSGAVGTSTVVYYDNVKQALSCIGDITWQSKD